MGSSKSSRKKHRATSPQTDGTPEGVDLAGGAGDRSEEEDGPDTEEALTVRLERVNRSVWNQTSVGERVTVDGQVVRVTGGTLGYLTPTDAQTAQNRGLGSGRVQGLPETPEPTAIVVLIP